MSYRLMEGQLGEDEEQPKGVFCSVFKMVVPLSLLVALSYTFSFEVFAIGILSRVLKLVNGTDVDSCDFSGHNASEVEEAVSTLITTTFGSVLMVAQSILLATSLVVSHDLGKLENLSEGSEVAVRIKQRIASANRNACLLALVLCCPPAMVALYKSSSILQAFGQEAEPSDIAQLFLRNSFLIPLATFPALVFEKILFAFKETKMTMVLSLPIFAVTTAFAVCVSLGCGFGPAGLAGLAQAYLGGNYATALAYGLYLGFGKKLRPFGFFNFWKLGCRHWGQFWETVRTGLSMLVLTLNEVYIFFALTLLAGYLGDEELERLNYVVLVYSFSFLIFGPVGEICGQEICRRIGARYYQKAADKTDPGAHEVAKYGLATAAVCTAPITIISTVVYYCLNSFKGELEDFMFPIFALGMYMHGLRYNLLQQQVSLSDKVISNVVSGIAVALGLGASAALGLFTNLGTVGLGAGYLGGMLLAFFLLYVRWRYFSNPEIMQIIEEKGPSPHNRLWFPSLKKANSDFIEINESHGSVNA